MKFRLKLYFIAIAIVSACICVNVDASSIDYNLKIDSNRQFYETIIYTFEDNTQNAYLKSILTDRIYFDKGQTLEYNKEIKNDNGNYVVTLENNYNYETFKNSRIIKECFGELNFNADEYGISFYTISPFYCSSHADKIKVRVESAFDVILNDADNIENNIYVWDKIDRDFGINLEIGQVNPNLNIAPPDNSNIQDVKKDIPIDLSVDIHENRPTIIIVICSLVVISGVVIIVVRQKKKAKKQDN